MVPAAIRGGCPPLSQSSQRGASLLSFDLGLEVLQVLFSQHTPDRAKVIVPPLHEQQGRSSWSWGGLS